VSGRRKLDPANVVKVWRLDEEELGAVRIIAARERYPDNFCEADAMARLSLEDFLRSKQEVCPFAQTDILDKWNVGSFSAEFFQHYIDRDQLAVPGTLSAKRTSKLIVYCLRILEAQHEVLQAGWVKALRRIPIDAQDVVNSLTARAGRLVSTHAGMELDYSLQFCAAVRNPVIQEAVNNAAVNRWGLSE
jgi:hypothetical protein